MTDARAKRYIGMKIAGGIVVGARTVGPTEVGFDVLSDGDVERHRISLT